MSKVVAQGLKGLENFFCGTHGGKTGILQNIRIAAQDLQLV